MTLRSKLCLGLAAAAFPLSFASAQIHVAPSGSDIAGDGSSGNPYQTISHAANEAISGDTIVLAAGTYGDTEEIVLDDKDLQIVGAGRGQTIIHPNATQSIVLPRGFPNAPTTDTHRVAIVVGGNARVDIRDLTIDCDFRMPANGRLHGLFYYDGADGSVQNVEVVNCRANPLTGAQGPAAIYIRGDDLGDSCDLEFRECLIHEFGKGGLVGFFNSNIVVEYCTVRGSGAVGVPLPAQNGIQMTYDAVGTIRFNRVSDIRYLPNSFGASGILCFNQGAGTVIEGNSVEQCEGAIWLVQSPAANRATFIRGNRSTGNVGPLWIQGNDGVVVENNVFHTLLSSELGVYDDSVAGNTWSGNNYSEYGGVGSFTIDGGNSTDSSPRSGCDEIGAPGSVALGGVPVEMVTLDLDGANGQDAVTVNEGASNSVSVALNDGAGNFTVTSTPFGNSGGRPVAIAAGDFDGDSDTDIAVLTVNRPANTTENKVYVFANTGGVLSLLHTESLPASIVTPNDLAAANLNGDSVADLAVADLGAFATAGAAHTLMNGGSGTTWTAAVLPGAFTTQVQGIAAADLDGVNGPDLAATEGDGANGRVHLWTNNGIGTFTAHAASPIAVSVNPNAVEAGDIDADGDIDLMIASIGAAAPIDEGVISVLVNDLPTGFSTRQLRTDRGPAAIAIGDLLDDDDPDTLRRDAAVVNLAGGSVKLLTAFDGYSFATGPQCRLGGTPRDVGLADVDGDGLTDVIVADAAGQNLLVHLGRFTALADLYGQGCPGTDDRIPQIRAVGAPAVPNQPNATFGVACSNARPFAVAVLNASFTPGATLGPCELLLGSIDVTWLTVTDVFGQSGVSIPIPAAPPSLEGLPLYFQWAVLDPEGDFLSLAALSAALKIRVGN